jgi:glutathione S-transferase
LAKKFNLAGKGEREEAEVNMYADQVTDLLNQTVQLYYEQDETRKTEMTRKLEEETTPAQLAIFEARLAKVGSGHLVASGFTFVDFYLTLGVEWLGDNKDAALANFPHVKKLIETVNSHPKIAAWIAKRPVTVM